MNQTGTLDPNLLATKKKVAAPGEPAAPAPASLRSRRIAKILAYVAIFLVALLFFILLKIPDSAVSNLVLGAANQNTPFRWQAERISARLFFLPHLRAEKLQLDPTMPGTGHSISLEELRVYPRFFSLIPWTGQAKPSFSFWTRGYGAEFDGAAKLGPAGAESFRLETENFDLAKFIPLQDAGVAVKGIVSSLAADLDLAGGDLGRASGSVKASGKNLVIDPASFQLPMALPILDLGPLELEAQAQNGKVNLKVLVGAPGKDIELRLQGTLQLNRNPAFSTADLSLQVKPSARIVTAIQALKGMLDTFGALRPDGFYAMKLKGTLANIGLPQPDR